MDKFTSFFTARYCARSRDTFYIIEEPQAYSRFGVQGHAIRRQALGIRHRKISFSSYDLPNYDVNPTALNSLQSTNSVNTNTLGDARVEKSKIEDVVWMERKLRSSESLSVNGHCDDTGINRTNVSDETEIDQHLQNFSRSPNFSHALSSQCSLSTSKTDSYTPHILSNVSPAAHLDKVNSKNDKNEAFKEPVCASDAWASGINKPPLHNSSFAPNALSNLHRLSVLKNLKLRTPSHKPILPHQQHTDSTSNGLIQRHTYKTVTPILDLQRQTRVLIPDYTKLKTPISQVTQSLSPTHTHRPTPNAFQFSSKTNLQTALINDQNINAAGQICDSKSEVVPNFRKNHHVTDLFNRERERLTSFHFHVAQSQNLRLKSQRDSKPPDRLTDWSRKMSANKRIKSQKTEDDPKFESPADIVQKIYNQTWVKEENRQAKRQSGQGEVAQESLVGNSLKNNGNVKQHCVTETVESHPTKDGKVYNHSNTESKENLNDHQTDKLRLSESRQNDTKSAIKTCGSVNYLKNTTGTSDNTDIKIAVDKNDPHTELHKSTIKTTTTPSSKNKGTSTDLHVKHGRNDMSDGDVANEVLTTLEKSSKLLKSYDQSWEPDMCKRNALQETLQVETEEPLPANLEYLEGNSPMIIGNNPKVFSKYIYESEQGDSFDVITRGKIHVTVENNSQHNKNDNVAHHVHKEDIKQPTRSDAIPTFTTNTDSISSTRGAISSSKHIIASSRSTVTQWNTSPHSQSLCTNDNDLPYLVTSRRGSHGSLKNKEETSVIFKADSYVISNQDNSYNGRSENARGVSVLGADPVCGRRVRGEWIVCRDYSKASKYSTEYGGKHNVWTTKENSHGDLERADENGHLCYVPDMLCNNQSRNEQGNTENVHNLKYHSTCLRPSDKKQIFTDESKHQSNVTSLINSSDSQENVDEPTSLMSRTGHSESNLSKRMSKSTGSLLSSKLSFKFSEMAKNRNKEYRSLNRFLGNRLITKEIHLNRPISRELMFKNRPISKEMKARNRPSSRESITGRMSRQCSFSDRPMSVGLFSKKTRMDNIHKICQPIAREILTSRTCEKEQYGQHQETHVDSTASITKTEAARFIYDVDKLQSFQTPCLNPVPCVNDAAQDMLDYFWSYQGMGRQILGVKSRERILKEGTEPSDMSLFDKFDKLPPIDTMTSQCDNRSADIENYRGSGSTKQYCESGTDQNHRRVKLVIRLPQPNKEEE